MDATFPNILCCLFCFPMCVPDLHEITCHLSCFSMCATDIHEKFHGRGAESMLAGSYVVAPRLLNVSGCMYVCVYICT